MAGSQNASPLNKFYWLQADTSGISGAPSTTRWTLYNRCEVSGGDNVHCTKTTAAYPFDPVRNFGTSTGVPSALADHRKTYYYETRFAFAFYLIAIFFDFFAFVFSFVGIPSRLGSGLSALSDILAFVFSAAASALITACYVKAKNAFKDDGHSAKLGVKMFAFTWTVVFLHILCFFFSCCACAGRKKSYGSDDAYYSSSAVGGFSGTSLRRNRSEKEIGSTPAQKRGFFHVKRKDTEYDSESQQPVIGSAAQNDASSFERSSPL